MLNEDRRYPEISWRQVRNDRGFRIRELVGAISVTATRKDKEK
jgi:hypothetical protein